MKRFFIQKLTEKKIKKAIEAIKKSDEEFGKEKIVDESSFVMDKENVRQAKLSGGDGAGQQGLYDNRTMSDLEIRLRDGTIDKAEITQEQLKLQKEIAEKDDKRKKEEKEAVRQAAIDAAIGVGQPEQEKPE